MFARISWLNFTKCSNSNPCMSTVAVAWYSSKYSLWVAHQGQSLLSTIAPLCPALCPLLPESWRRPWVATTHIPSLKICEKCFCRRGSIRSELNATGKVAVGSYEPSPDIPAALGGQFPANSKGRIRKRSEGKKREVTLGK